jgi:excisionase family DNA binding protein
MSDVVRVVLQPGQRLEVSYAQPAPRAEREAYTLDELAERHGITVRSLRGLIASGRLPATKAGRSYVVRADDAARAFAPTLRTRATKAGKPAIDDSDEAIDRRLRARGVRVGAPQ